MRINLYFPILFLFVLVTKAQNPLVAKDTLSQMEWVNDTYKNMSLEEKIGQLFMVSMGSNESRDAADKINSLIENNHLGGVIFLRGGPIQQVKLTNEFQSKSKIPLLIGMDAEWGLAMRLDSTYAFPWNMTLGAIQDNKRPITFSSSSTS